MWRNILKALIFALVWIEFPFWFLMWLILSIIRLNAVKKPWEGMMKGTLQIMSNL